MNARMILFSWGDSVQIWHKSIYFCSYISSYPHIMKRHVFLNGSPHCPITKIVPVSQVCSIWTVLEILQTAGEPHLNKGKREAQVYNGPELCLFWCLHAVSLYCHLFINLIHLCSLYLTLNNSLSVTHLKAPSSYLHTQVLSIILLN